MSIQTENYISSAQYISHAQFLEKNLIRELRETADYKALAEFFSDACVISGVVTLGSLFFLDKQVTLLCGLTTTLTLLANAYFGEKCISKGPIIETLNLQIESLKKQVKAEEKSTVRAEEKSTDQIQTQSPTPPQQSQ